MNFRGAMTALVTPMRNGGLDIPALASLIEEQIAAGIDGIVAVGTTGESATLSVEEHVEVIRQTVQAVAGRVPVVAGAGANSTEEAIVLSEASLEAGAQALLHVTPYYNKPTQEGLYQHFAAIADRTDLPIILYNVPGRTACDMTPKTVARLAKLSSVVAIKEASGDLRVASEILDLCGDSIDLLSGDDFTAFPLLSLGGKGVISVVSNVAPAHVARMCKAAREGRWDDARKEHFATLKLAAALFVESNPIPVKAALEMQGKIGPELRLPLTPAVEATRKGIEAALAELF